MELSDTSSEYKGYQDYVFVQKFERDFDHDKVMFWMRRNWHLSLYLAAIYLVFIAGLKEFMRNRKPLQIRRVVMLWDFALAIFSVCGMLRALPEMFHIVSNYGLEFSMCNSNANAVSYFWALAFAFSKAVELLDTVFVVLNKQDLTFLHVAHHVLTLVLTWYFSVDAPGGARWMTSLNYSIHSVMYTYFALKAVKIHVPRKVSMCVTLAQIIQFCVGIVGVMFAIRANFLGRPCTTTMTVAVGMALFCSFLLCLFVKFFIRRYTFVKSDNKTKLS